MIVVLSGGVGAARLLRVLRRAAPSESITAIVNVGDDLVLHGLTICPDLDTITYTLGNLANDETGWGRREESWRVMDELESLGGQTWFRLGDRDLATHLFRSQRLAEGATKTDVTHELAARWDLGVRLLPVSDDPVSTRLDTEIGSLSFQEYFVRQRHDVTVHGVDFVGADLARPTAAVVEALRDATRVVIAPSNPVVSIGPILAVAGVRDLVARRRHDVVAVSPLVAGRALKGPADRLLRELGFGTGQLAVARAYRGLLGRLVIDESDAAEAPSLRANGLDVTVTTTVMGHDDADAALAEAVLS